MKKWYFVYCAAVFLTIWTASGTLAPYAASHAQTRVEEPCQYLLNGDHPHFEAVFLFLDGEPAERWNQSVVLRRILFPIIAYPLMKLFGFVGGGFCASVLLHMFAGCIFIRFLHRTYSARTAKIAACVLPVFPGIAYFGALPYSYACIAPFSLLGFIALSRLQTGTANVADSLKVGLFIGLLSVGYDLLPYFAPAGALVLVFRKRWLVLPLFLIACCFFPFLTVTILQKWYGISLLNTNTASYMNIVKSYLQITAGISAEWATLLEKMPAIFIANFLFSMFAVLPVAAVVLAMRSFFSPIPGNKHVVECALLLSGLVIWLFNNAAPPYDGWQMRGVWIARIYEPLFVPLLVFVCRALADKFTLVDKAICSLIFLFQAWISYGPLLGKAELSDYLYTEFYQHSVHGAFTANLQKYGRRPYGFCAHDATPSA